MGFERLLLQDVTYWAPSVQDGFGGTNFQTPVTYKGRWEDELNTVIDARGRSVDSKAKVFLNAADAGSIEVGGYLMLGTPSSNDPLLNELAFPILDIKKVPDLRLIRTLLIAYL